MASEDLSLWLMAVVSDGDGTIQQVWLGGGGLGVAGVCGWMMDDVDRAREVRDGLCYQPSRRQAAGLSV